MVKRLLCVVAAAVVLAALAAGWGCRSADKKQEDDRPLTIWWAQWDPADGLAEIGQEFEKEFGIAVKVHQIPWSNYQDQVFLNFGQKTTDFDIVIGDSQWIGRGATKGLYVDLTDWLPKAVDLATVHPKALRYLCEYPPGSGRYYAAPCETDAIGFAYRRDWFDNVEERTAFRAKYGRDLAVPDTWEEFKEVAEFFHRPDEKRYGCSVLTGRGYDELTMGFQQVMWSFGGSWGDEKTFRAKGFVDSDASVAALEFYKELLQYAPKGGANFSYGQTLEAFTNGSTAMVMDYFAFFPGIVTKMGDKAGFFIMPRKGDLRVASLGGQGMSVSAKVPPRRQELAKKFIAWFCQRKVQQEWITKPAGFTANTDILRGDAFRSATPYNAPFAESLNYLQDFWNVPSYNSLLAVAQKYVGEALDGVKTPRQALEAIAAEHDKEFRDAGLRQD